MALNLIEKRVRTYVEQELFLPEPLLPFRRAEDTLREITVFPQPRQL